VSTAVRALCEVRQHVQRIYVLLDTCYWNQFHTGTGDNSGISGPLWLLATVAPNPALQLPTLQHSCCCTCVAVIDAAVLLQQLAEHIELRRGQQERQLVLEVLLAYGMQLLHHLRPRPAGATGTPDTPAGTSARAFRNILSGVLATPVRSSHVQRSCLLPAWVEADGAEYGALSSSHRRRCRRR
jgi:hypothetical protein